MQMLQKLLGVKSPERQREALRKRAIERILAEEYSMPKAARVRIASRIFREVLHDEPR